MNRKLNLIVEVATLLCIYFMPQKWQGACAREAKNGSLLKYDQKAGKTKMTIKNDEEIDKSRVSPEGILQSVSELQDIGFIPMGDLSRDQSRIDHVTSLLPQQSTPNNVESVGTLAIRLRHENGVQDAEASPYLNDLDGEEWVALFRDVLDCPMGINEPYFPGDNIGERHEKFRLKFQQTLKDYPMLGRIWDTYIDVTYTPEDIKELRDECLKIRPVAADNQIALRGLNKLINACDEALRFGAGLDLLCD